MTGGAGAPPGGGAGRVLLTGWFSFDNAEVTGGDLQAARAAEGWLRAAGADPLVATAANFRAPGEVAWDEVEPSAVSHLVFVCGPLGGALVERLFARFPAANRVAAGVSVVDSTSRLGPLRVIERDGGLAGASVDLAMDAPAPGAPVVGVVRSHAQPEYGDRQAHDAAHAVIDQALLGARVAPIEIDTRLHPGEPHLCSTPGQLLALLGRCDAIVTTRLHGLVLGLRAGVPVVAVDPVEGGAKVTAQAEALGWPAVLAVGHCDAAAVQERLLWCLTPDAWRAAAEAVPRAATSLERSRRRLLSSVDLDPDVDLAPRPGTDCLVPSRR